MFSTTDTQAKIFLGQSLGIFSDDPEARTPLSTGNPSEAKLLRGGTTNVDMTGFCLLDVDGETVSSLKTEVTTFESGNRLILLSGTVTWDVTIAKVSSVGLDIILVLDVGLVSISDFTKFGVGVFRVVLLKIGDNVGLVLVERKLYLELKIGRNDAIN